MSRLVRSITLAPSALGRALVGPIFQREVRALGRRRSPYWLRFTYAFCLLAIVTLVFLAVWDFDQGMSGMYGTSGSLEFLAPAMLATVAMVQMSALALIAPVLTAGAIADEKRMRTLSTLLTTPLSSRDLVLGKLAAGTVQLGVLAMIPMPLLLALRVFGGVESEAIVASLVLSLSLGLLGASLALMFSIWHRRTPSIVFYALCSIAVITGAPWMLGELSDYVLDTDLVATMLHLVAPYAQMLVLYPEILGSGSVAQTRIYWLTAVGYNTSITLVLVLFSMFVLRGVLRREAAGGASQGTLARFITPGVEPDAAVRNAAERDPRMVGDAPIFWREVRQGATGSRIKTAAILGIGVVILMVLYATAGMDSTGLTPTIAVITAMALAMQAALTTPNAISSERDAGNWGVLLTTPVTGRQVVMGKVAGAIRRLWLLPALLALHMAVVMVLGWLHPVAALHTVILLGGLVLMLAGTGIFLGMFCKRGITASVANMAVPITLYVGLPVLLAMIANMLDYRHGGMDWAQNFIALSSPFILLAEATGAASSEYEPHQFYLRYGPLGLDEVHLGGFTFYTLICGVGTSLIGVAAMTAAIAGFDRFNGRPS